MATKIRQAADGMDSETLQKQQAYVASPVNHNTNYGRHANLTASQKSASIVKVPTRNYIPHEPVRGAVKHVQGVGHKDVTPAATSTLGKSAAAEKSSLSWNQTPIKGSNPSHVINIDNRDQNQDIANKYRTSTPVKSSHATTISPRMQQLVSDKQTANVSEADVRLIEGGLSVIQEQLKEQAQLNKKLEAVQKELDNQLKVNSDLKRLLVASVGDDLHEKVESLVKDKASLSEEVGAYNRRAHQDHETKDKLYIQADVWSTKYKASKVLYSQLSEQHNDLLAKMNTYQNAIQGLLHERGQLRHTSALTYRYMKLMQEAFDAHNAHKYTIGTQSDLLQLCALNAQLGETIKHRLIGTTTAPIGAVDLLAGASWTPAEVYAQQVMRGAKGALPALPHSTSSSKLDYHGRFHPLTSYDNITFNCCKKCKGEIHIV